MNYNDLAGKLNNMLSTSIGGWRGSELWENQENKPPAVHMLYSAVLAVIGDAQVLFADGKLADSKDALSDYEAVFVTNDFVIRAVRVEGNFQPVVTIARRSSLKSLEIVSVPLLTMTSFFYHDTTVTVRLTYPTFTVEVSDKHGDNLLAALPSFVADLAA